MKKILIIVVAFFFLNAGLAQEKYLSISGGYTIPLGDFSSSDINSKQSGFANNGYNFSFEMTFFFSDFVGLGANLRFNNVSFNSQLFNDLLIEKFQGQLESISLTSGNYNLHNFLIGPYIKFDAGDYFSLYGKAFLGVMTTFRPNQSLNYKLPLENSQSIETVGKYSGSFAYNLGAGAFVKFNRKLGLRLSADYIAGNPKYEDFDFDNLEVIEKKQAVAYMNYNAGLMLTF